MIYLNAFLLPAFTCMIGQVILDNTKLTAGHITSIFTVFGAILSFLGIYPTLIEKAGAGATILISNFGHMLFIGGMQGYNEQGFLGIFAGLLSKSSLAITSAVIIAFVFSILFKPKN